MTTARASVAPFIYLQPGMPEPCPCGKAFFIFGALYAFKNFFEIALNYAPFLGKLKGDTFL